MDNFEPFRRIDAKGYNPDKPLGTVLLRRFRKQVKSLMEFPNSVGSIERRVPARLTGKGIEIVPLYSAVPRTIHYHPRRLPAGLSGLSFWVPFAAGPYGTTPESAGEARAMVRAGGRTYYSDWQTIETTASGDRKPYEFTITGMNLTTERWGQVMIVARSFADGLSVSEAILEGPSRRVMIREDPGVYGDGQPYGLNNTAELDGIRYDFLLIRGAVPSPDGGSEFVNVYGMAPPRGEDNTLAIIRELHYLSTPLGVTIREIWPEQDPVAYGDIKANRSPKSATGPGSIFRSFQRYLKRPQTTSVGPPYPGTEPGYPSSAWKRLPRWRYHPEISGGGNLKMTFSEKLINKSTRVRVLLATITVDTGTVSNQDSASEIWALAKDVEVDLTLSVVKPTDLASPVATATETVRVVQFPLDYSGHSPFLLEQWIALEGSINDRFTYREGQLYVGREDNEIGDLSLVSLQWIDVEVDEATFDANGLTTETPVRLVLDFSAVGVDDQIIVVGSSIQQYHA